MSTFITERSNDYTRAKIFQESSNTSFSVIFEYVNSDKPIRSLRYTGKTLTQVIAEADLELSQIKFLKE